MKNDFEPEKQVLKLGCLSMLRSMLTVILVCVCSIRIQFLSWKCHYGFHDSYLWLNIHVIQNGKKFIMPILIWPKIEKGKRVLTVGSFPLETANSLLRWVRNKKERMSLQMKYLIQSRCHGTHSKRKTLKWVLHFFWEMKHW